MHTKSNRWPWLDESHITTFWIVLCVVLMLWCIGSVGLIILHFKSANSGLIGDTFGILNSLFSALAFAGLFYTILLQKKELKETREEFIEQTRTFKKQNRAIVVQRFETVLFNMLSLHQESVNNLKDIEAKNVIGRRLFLDIIALFSLELTKVSDNGDQLKQPKIGAADQAKKEFDELVRKIILNAVEMGKHKKAFQTVVNRYNFAINHYLKSLVAISKFINESKLIANWRRKHYNEIFSSYISHPELVFLMYHYNLSNENAFNGRIRDVIDKLDLAKDFNREDYSLANVIDIKLFRDLVNSSAVN